MTKAIRGPKSLKKLAPDRPRSGTVYIVGAGFSAGLDYPLVNDLLIRLWDRLQADQRGRLERVITFHHPGFNPTSRTSFPTIELLLSEMMANEQLFDSSRSASTGFSLKELRGIRRDLLISIAEWFHEIQRSVLLNPPGWLKKFTDSTNANNDTIISFNWDLVLDELLFGDKINSANYGFGKIRGDSAILLKPHGSLNWYDDKQGGKIRSDLRFLLHDTDDNKGVYAFKKFRSPRSSTTKYTPLIIPPVYNKVFQNPMFSSIWRECVAQISQASKVVILGYSLPDADLHARFLLRCGFYNQIFGEPVSPGKRGDAVGASKIVIVNPDQGAASRIERALGSLSPSTWEPTTVSKWIPGTAL